MTNTPGDGPNPPEPSDDQPGNGEQQAQRPPGQPPTQPYPQPYQQQGGYAPPPQWQQGYAPQAPVQYAPDHPRTMTVLILGILGLVLCQVLSPFAWVMGKRTLDEIDASGGRIGGRSSTQVGYILGIVGSVILGLGLLAVVVWFVFMVVIVGGGMAG